ncbi:MAG: amidohydrolase family protein [Candidatus Syntropharchaeia archaeon]
MEEKMSEEEPWKKYIDIDKPPIDVHMHTYTKSQWRAMGTQFRVLDGYLYHRYFDTQEEYEKDKDQRMPTEQEMYETYKNINAMGLPVSWDQETVTGDPPTTLDYLLDLIKTYPDTFPTGWFMPDPHKGEIACRDIERAAKSKKIIGIKFQQAAQKFDINDPQYEYMWELIEDLGLPVQLHCGYTGLGTGAPKSQGMKLARLMPIPVIEELALKYEFKIILLHVCDPWNAEAIALCRHMENVYRECSGMWPRYWPEDLWYDVNRRIQDKVMFGTDFPLFPLYETLEQHEAAKDEKGMKGYRRKEIKEKVMYKNALRIFKEDFERCGVDVSRWEE